ncbi:hypothetical protein K437DRAFT_255533 [Tilletiaria anomala UBC 951]|uniref:Flavin reductase like domain-containing protein n=1 Tax=Tilletiaria anomala (strain ATCC 24038 / CBS 436.72 / UBC 951) TaxID=1037660 RepID=A0A066W3B0_TILAU|nr:uncharacterized protein K437DRAFT_255533 [Tilletiaria anomala UBC 951]KDN48427.1 hypothetical protein K437DRAFT_255533 [Tilletiaria anomala UBC 951]
MSTDTRPPFKETEASRPSFDASLSSSFSKSQAPDVDWKPGQGTNDTHEAPSKYHYKIIVPGKTEIGPMDMYKLMLGGISPRPVALVTTKSKEGQLNLCPVSWYQMLSHNPPLVMLSFGGDQGRRKDSEVNIEATGEFTISSASEPYAEALNYSSIDAPHGTSEYALTGLTPVASRLVSPPRVKEAPFSMECKLDFRREYYADGSGVSSLTHEAANGQGKGGLTTVIVVARVVVLHVREDCLNEDGSVNMAQMLPLTRVSGMLYTRTTHGFELVRPKWDEVKDTPEVQAALKREVTVVPPDFEDPILLSYP